MENSRQPAANLTLGMIHLGSAKFFRELHDTALAIEMDYLKQLSRQRTGKASRYVYYFMGLALLEAGEPADSAKYLRRFARSAGARSAMKPYADIDLGIAYVRLKNPQNAARLWSGVDAKRPEIKAALASAYAVTGAKNINPVLMAEDALKEAGRQHRTVDSRMIRNMLRAYSQGGATEKSLELLEKNDFKEAAYTEELGSSKTINFYDLSVLDSMAIAHLNAAIMYLKEADRDAKLGVTARYYLADAYLQQGDAEMSLHAAISFLAQPKIPAQYGNSARVQQAIAYRMMGQKADSAEIWQSLVDKSARDPELLTALMQACAPASADCKKIEKISLAAVENGEGKKFFPLNAALGKYYLSQKNYAKAVLFMEAGRDKANKNKIDVNDPVMLMSLAEAYYRSKQFSESLEIYFEIGKQFPAIRQVQEAMQGIYAMEHKSAGDVKIY